MRLIDIIDQEYISSSSVTPQYKTAKRKFKSLMTQKFFPMQVIITSCPHFEFTGFIKRMNKYVYFSTGDLRWKTMNSMLVRTAKSDEDYTGGSNNFVNYDENFDERFIKKVKELLEVK